MEYRFTFETVGKRIPHIRKLTSMPLKPPVPLCKISLTNMSIIILITASGLETLVFNAEMKIVFLVLYFPTSILETFYK